MSMTMPDAPGPIVEVEWIDSTGHEGWQDAEAWRELWDKCGCRSAGYLIDDSKQGIVIALGKGGFGGLLDTMAIPRGQILAVRRVEPEAAQ